MAIKHGKETPSFAKIFKTAPVWLLEFTQVWVDAWLLNFKLPPLSHVQGMTRKGNNVLHRDWHSWPDLLKDKWIDADFSAEDEGSPLDEKWRRWMIEERINVRFTVFDKD